MTARPRTHTYLTGAASGVLAKCAGSALGLLLTPYLLRELGPEGFGIAALALSVMTWLSLVDLGLAAGLRAHLARFSGHEFQRRADALCRAVGSAQRGVAAAAVTVGLGAAALFPYAFAIDAGLTTQAQVLFGLLAAAAGLALWAQVPCALLGGSQRLFLENAVRVAAQLVRAAVLVGALAAGFGLLAVGLAQFAAAVALLMLARAVARWRPSSRLSRECARDDAEWRSCRRAGLWFSLGSIAGLLIAAMDRAVAARMLSLEAVTTLAVSASAFLLAESLFAQAVNAVRPALGQLQSEKGFSRAWRVFAGFQSAALAAAAILAAALFAANPLFVTAWVGGAHHGGAALDLLLALHLMLGSYLLTHRVWLSSALIVRPQTLVRLAEGALNLALSVWLAPLWGLAGIAAATVAAAAVTSAWRLPQITRQTLAAAPHPRPYSRDHAPAGIAGARHDSNTGAAALGPAALPVCAAWMLAVALRTSLTPASGWAGVLAAAGVPFLVGLWLMWRESIPAAAKLQLARALPWPLAAPRVQAMRAPASHVW